MNLKCIQNSKQDALSGLQETFERKEKQTRKYISLIWNTQKKFQIESRLCGQIRVRFKTQSV